jgi:hypothetical protein
LRHTDSSIKFLSIYWSYNFAVVFTKEHTIPISYPIIALDRRCLIIHCTRNLYGTVLVRTKSNMHFIWKHIMQSLSWNTFNMFVIIY